MPFKQWVWGSNPQRVTKNPECTGVRDFFFFLCMISIDYRSIGRYNKTIRQRTIRQEEPIMERGNTKQDILEAALDLFSVQGFEATSISQLAGAVGIRKASLYSHFERG